MKKSVSFLISFTLVVLVFSCTKESSAPDTDIVYSTDNEHIKSISANGAVIQKYLYDVAVLVMH